jgi:peptidoglycan-associated lipoprotein
MMPLSLNIRKRFFFTVVMVVVVGCLFLFMTGCGNKSMKRTVDFHDNGEEGETVVSLDGMASSAGTIGESDLADQDVNGNEGEYSVEDAELASGLAEWDQEPTSKASLTSMESSTSGDSQPAGSYVQVRRQAEAETAALGIRDIFFGYDSWSLSEEAKGILESNATWLKAHPHKRVTIEGHCDERGTQAYNVALGQKRANMARNYLTMLGVSKEQLLVTSYGKDKPVCRNFTEKCFTANRRAHMVVGLDHVAANYLSKRR